MPEDDAAGLAREWLRYAEYDLAAANTLSTAPPASLIWLPSMPSRRLRRRSRRY
jgi:hypothetical protein